MAWGFGHSIGLQGSQGLGRAGLAGFRASWGGGGGGVAFGNSFRLEELGLNPKS